jgi:hypothetical protein
MPISVQFSSVDTLDKEKYLLNPAIKQVLSLVLKTVQNPSFI